MAENPIVPNPYAFPSKSPLIAGNPNDLTVHHGGMALRDYFAAKAMQGLVSNPKYFSCDKEQIREDLIFKRAYSIADAMLEERRK